MDSNGNGEFVVAGSGEESGDEGGACLGMGERDGGGGGGGGGIGS